MASKGKKGKKRNVKTKPENNVHQSKQEANNSKNKLSIYTYFSSEEITDIKATLKVKDANCVPYIIGAIVLNKFDLLKKLIKQGSNINDSGPNNVTPLMWAVKYKNMEIIEFLISKGADPTIKTDNGDNVLIVALEHKSWEEQSYIYLWNLVKSVTFVDVNYTTKNGHNLLHIAVRRDWENFIKLLVNENVNVNIANSNGVTPLMLACYRNNYNIVTSLLEAGANILKEDNHNRLALCYAISSEVKNSKPPFVLIDKVLGALIKHISVKDYIEKIIDTIITVAGKSEFSNSTSEMMVYVIQYIVHYLQNGAKILMNFNIFTQIARIMSNSSNTEILKFLMTVTMEILFYNEQTENFNPEVLRSIVKCFLNADLPSVCINLIRCASPELNNMLAFYVLVLFSTNHYFGQNWLKDNLNDFKPISDKYIVESFNHLQNQTFNDEKRVKTMRKKLKKLKRSLSFISSRQTEKPIQEHRDKSNESVTRAPEENKVDLKQETTLNTNPGNTSSSKKIKRRSKAMKAKIASMKKVELAERLNLTGKKVTEVEDESKIECCVQCARFLFSDAETMFNDSASVDSTSSFSKDLVPHVTEEEAHNFFKKGKNISPYPFLQYLQNENYTYITRPYWVSQIHNLPFDCPPFLQNLLAINKTKLMYAFQYLKKLSHSIEPPTRDLSDVVDIIIDYLTQLLQIIVIKYQNHWSNDKKKSEKDKENEDDDDKDRETQETYLQYVKQMEKQEKLAIDELQKQFKELIESIKKLSKTDIADCYQNICVLEENLLKIKIRGCTLLYDICAYENVNIWYKYVKDQTEQENDANVLLHFIENSLNDRVDYRLASDIHIKIDSKTENDFVFKEFQPAFTDDQFYEEISKMSTPKPGGSNENQPAEDNDYDSYHLFHEMATICDSDEEDVKEESVELAASSLFKKPKNEFKFPENVDKENSSRWSQLIRRLMSETEVQKLLSGDVIISKSKSKSQEYTISRGGNFNPVILGLTSNHQPLAVKQLPKEHSICKIMKSLINPLLGLRHKYILHYYACDYEFNELILATPLCEFNVGQYVLFFKNTSNHLFNLKPINMAKQFLLGLKYLHVRKEPIVHGNLKPSNIFVDLHGIIKVAEFGTHKALYKRVEAPKNALIWLAQETYKGYKQHSTIDCTCASDIQVAGMLIYFILSGGVHPYGNDVNVILKLLEKAMVNLPKMPNITLTDIVAWMMMYEPNERPTIDQVLSHVIFWSDERKWRFILNCSGISLHRDHNFVPLDIDVNNLHNSIDKLSVQDEFNINWIDRFRANFPNLCYGGDDTTTGLLRHIRYFCENQNQLDMREKDLSKYILTYFPDFPLTLYRILDATNWLKHPLFYEYTQIEHILP